MCQKSNKLVTQEKSTTLGVPGVPWHTQTFADQLTLFQPGGQILSTLYNLHPQFFSPSSITAKYIHSR